MRYVVVGYIYESNANLLLQDHFLMPASLLVLQCVLAVSGLCAQAKGLLPGVPHLLCSGFPGGLPD